MGGIALDVGVALVLNKKSVVRDNWDSHTIEGFVRGLR